MRRKVRFLEHFHQNNPMASFIRILALACLCLTASAAHAQQYAPFLSILSDDGKDTLFRAAHVVLQYSPDSAHVSITHQHRHHLVFELPYHQLRTDHLEAVWDTRGKTLYFHSNDTHDRFYSLDSASMELEFSSSDASLDLHNKVLLAKKVPGIYTRNAMVVPSQHELAVSGPSLPPLADAQILLNSFTRYHHLHAGEVIIRSRKDFQHSGGLSYEYYHAPTQKHYRFGHVKLHTEKQVTDFRVVFITSISVKIAEEDGFELFEGKVFKGEATAFDHERSLTFKGHLGYLVDGKMVWEPYEGNGFLGRF
jgi:hypothetical protein